MNIGFDLDKIFINHPPFIPSWIIQKLYGEKSNGHLSYRTPGHFEQYLRKLSHIPLLRPPMTQNILAVQAMVNKKHMHFFLISSRFGFLKPETEVVINKYQLRELFDHMDFNEKNEQPHLFKQKKIKEHNIQRFIDDDLPLLSFLAKKNPHTVFFWLNPHRNDKLSNNLYAITDISYLFT